MKTKQRLLSEDWELLRQRRFIQEQVRLRVGAGSGSCVSCSSDAGFQLVFLGSSRPQFSGALGLRSAPPSPRPPPSPHGLLPGGRCCHLQVTPGVRRSEATGLGPVRSTRRPGLQRAASAPAQPPVGRARRGLARWSPGICLHEETCFPRVMPRQLLLPLVPLAAALPRPSRAAVSSGHR